MKWLILDTETTDLITNSVIRDEFQPRVIEFQGTMIDPDTGEILMEYNQLINPDVEISEEASSITKITKDMLQDKPRFLGVAEDIKAMIEEADAVVAHNLSYDYSVVEGEMKRARIVVKWPIRRICTVEETEWFHGFRLSLSALYEDLFAEKFEGAHRAKNDVEALVRCVLELRKRGAL